MGTDPSETRGLYPCTVPYNRRAPHKPPKFDEPRTPEQELDRLKLLAWYKHRTAHDIRARPGARVILVCGGRDYTDRDRVFAALDLLHSRQPIDLVVHGMCRTGADDLADAWASTKCQTEWFPADWRSHGAAAGPLRNEEMAAAGASGCVAFPGGRGTAGMVDLCKQYGIPVWRPYATST